MPKSEIIKLTTKYGAILLCGWLPPVAKIAAASI